MLALTKLGADSANSLELGPRLLPALQESSQRLRFEAGTEHFEVFALSLLLHPIAPARGSAVGHAAEPGGKTLP